MLHQSKHIEKLATEPPICSSPLRIQKSIRTFNPNKLNGTYHSDVLLMPHDLAPTGHFITTPGMRDFVIVPIYSSYCLTERSTKKNFFAIEFCIWWHLLLELLSVLRSYSRAKIHSQPGKTRSEVRIGWMHETYVKNIHPDARGYVLFEWRHRQ